MSSKLKLACLNGDLNEIQTLIETGVKDWNNGLWGACISDHMNIVELMIEKGADDWNYGLLGACEGGHINIVKLMIKKVPIIGIMDFIMHVPVVIWIL